jgi:riboflavin kinase / FMN adenylyltransferase
MLVIYGLDAPELPITKSAVAIGAFDGIHTGHQAIIETAVRRAAEQGCPSVVFTFDRHPAELLRPDKAPPYINTPAQRVELVRALGANYLVIAHFDEALSQQTPEEFAEEILRDRLHACDVVVGHDFRFGRGRVGDPDLLRELGIGLGFAVHALEPVIVLGLPASSTRTREYIAAGEIGSAEALLGHPFILNGTVVKGKQLGRILGFPTANLECTYRQVVPANGIYAVAAKLTLRSQWLFAACSIGVRPTVEDGRTERTIETFLFDFNEDIYGQEMDLRFVEYLRPELKFDGLDALVQQMHADCARAQEILNRDQSAATSNIAASIG